ncbi:MAG: hypothetical protein KC776_23870 [Myxococcales bacterium]|nr:hypothetical protein [Myxococcales bacterium]MCB9580382.1 hypothetical protein [Polyangiaceae bacterium]
MSRGSKLALAVGALLPLLAIVGIAVFAVYRVITIELSSTGHLSGNPFPTLFGSAFSTAEWLGLAFAMIGIALLELLLAIPFSIHAARLPGATTAFIALWIAAFVFVGVLAFPVYWLFYVLPDRPRRPTMPEINVGTSAWA